MPLPCIVSDACAGAGAASSGVMLTTQAASVAAPSVRTVTGSTAPARAAKTGSGQHSASSRAAAVSQHRRAVVAYFIAFHLLFQ